MTDSTFLTRLAPKDKSPEAKPSTTQSGMIFPYEGLRSEVIHFKKHRSSYSDEKAKKLWEQVQDSRRDVAAQIAEGHRQLQGNPINRATLEIQIAFLLGYMEDTRPPILLEYELTIDKDWHRIRNTDNSRGDRESYWQLCGQSYACLYGLKSLHEMRYRHYDNWETAIENLLGRMDQFAQIKAAELRSKELSEKQYDKLMAQAAARGEKWRAKRLEKMLITEQNERHADEAKKKKRDAARTQRASHDFGFNGSVKS